MTDLKPRQGADGIERGSPHIASMGIRAVSSQYAIRGDCGDQDVKLLIFLQGKADILSDTVRHTLQIVHQPSAATKPGDESQQGGPPTETKQKLIDLIAQRRFN
ncbi:hypothetical protein [Peteryoungia ipomoeae]|uniref:Uncharacterized protein n=1 Tax=Peteryoungia ipomoeae TaxID=1210932 RepID=A0A4V4HN72_9HYPH|nr:hypothetical protein [Peteryoungia ipomoeae]THV24986.1 hypothetical protein FAA97_01905 [Peteryoungia ipomoeae]